VVPPTTSSDPPEVVVVVVVVVVVEAVMMWRNTVSPRVERLCPAAEGHLFLLTLGRLNSR